MANAIAQDDLRRLVYSKKHKLEFFRQFPVNQQGLVLRKLSRYQQKYLLEQLNDQEVIDLLRYLDPDDSTILLRVLNQKRRDGILSQLGKDLREKVEFLLKFDPRTAAGLMSLDYVVVESGTKFDDVSGHIKRHEKQTGKFPAILVVENGYLKGEVKGHVFALESNHSKVGKFVHKLPAVKYNASEKDLLRQFEKNGHNKVVVLDDDGSIMGVIYANDILSTLHQRRGENLYSFAGVRDEEDVLDPAREKVRYRYRWLILNLATAFLAASVVGLFEDTIAAVTLLAVYMPIVAGMGGNAGTQAMAVMVRGLVMKEVDLMHSGRVVMREALAGSVNGLIIGIIVAAIAALWNQNPMLGVVIGTAMVINLIVAGFFGSIIPLVMEKLGKDPASSASIFITTATDVFGFFTFLGLAKLLLV